MDTNFKISNILYNMKHIGDLYYDLSSKAAKECNLTKPEADILLFIKNTNAEPRVVPKKGISKITAPCKIILFHRFLSLPFS